MTLGSLGQPGAGAGRGGTRFPWSRRCRDSEGAAAVPRTEPGRVPRAVWGNPGCCPSTALQRPLPAPRGHRREPAQAAHGHRALVTEAVVAPGGNRSTLALASGSRAGGRGGSRPGLGSLSGALSAAGAGGGRSVGVPPPQPGVPGGDAGAGAGLGPRPVQGQFWGVTEGCRPWGIPGYVLPAAGGAGMCPLVSPPGTVVPGCALCVPRPRDTGAGMVPPCPPPEDGDAGGAGGVPPMLGVLECVPGVPSQGIPVLGVPSVLGGVSGCVPRCPHPGTAMLGGTGP